MEQTQTLASNNRRKKRRILMGTLIPLTVIGVALGVALPLTMCHEQTTIKIIYADDTTIIETAGNAGSRTFEVFDNADNPINDATITFTPTRPISFFSVGHVADNRYQFEWSNQSTTGQYPITIMATTPSGLNASFDIILDITQPMSVTLTISTTNFSTYFNGTSPNVGGYKQAFTDYLNQNNVNKIVFDIDNISVGNSVFQNYAELQNSSKSIAIEFTSASISIGSNAFLACKSISQIICSSTAAPTITSIGNSAFNGCMSLVGFSRGNNAGKITIASIGNFAFNACKNLDATKINSSIITLNGCTWTPGTGTHTIDSGYWRKGTDNKLDSVGNLAVGTISCPFATIGVDTFARCASIIEIDDLPGGSIGESAFFDCKSLTTIKFAATTAKTTSIGAHAFDRCAALQSIQLSTGWTTGSTIDTSAFNGCPNSGGTISGTDAAALLGAIKATNQLPGWTATT